MLLIGSQVGSLVIWTHPSTLGTRASLPTVALSLVGSTGLLVLSYVEHVYSYRPSTVLNLFLLFSTILDAARTRTLWLQEHNGSRAVASLVTVVMKLAVLALEMVEKRNLLRPPFHKLPPEVTSGIFSQWIFSWQLTLFRAGYSKQLEIDDLFSLDKHLKSQYLQDIMRSGWGRGLST